MSLGNKLFIFFSLSVLCSLVLSAPHLNSKEYIKSSATLKAMESLSLAAIYWIEKKGMNWQGFEKSLRKDTQMAKTYGYLRKLNSKQGLFVSIFDVKNLRLIGCMGSLRPHRKSVFDEVVHWSTMAVLHDDRFVTANKANKFKQNNPKKEISFPKKIAVIITLIDSLEAVRDYMEIDVIRDGMLIKFQGREELVLPGEARTAKFAFKMIWDKLGQKFNNNLTHNFFYEIFRVKAFRFGRGKDLFAKKGKQGYGG